jgi:hypothetical protein
MSGKNRCRERNMIKRAIQCVIRPHYPIIISSNITGKITRGRKRRSNESMILFSNWEENGYAIKM